MLANKLMTDTRKHLAEEKDISTTKINCWNSKPNDDSNIGDIKKFQKKTFWKIKQFQTK